LTRLLAIVATAAAVLAAALLPLAAYAAETDVNTTYYWNASLQLGVLNASALPSTRYSPSASASVAPAQEALTYRYFPNASASCLSSTPLGYNWTPGYYSALRPFLVNASFRDLAGPVVEQPEPGHVYNATLCIYVGHQGTNVTINMSGEVYEAQAPSAVVCVTLGGWRAPLSLWGEPVVVSATCRNGTSTLWSASTTLEPYRYTRVASYSYTVTGSTVTVKATIVMNQSGLPAIGETVRLVVDGRLVGEDNATPPQSCLGEGYVYAMTQCSSTVSFTFTASPGVHTVEIQPVHGVASAVLQVRVESTWSIPTQFPGPLPPPGNVTLGNWTPPGPFTVPVDLSPTSPTGILLYLLVLAAYIGLASRLGWAEAFIPLSVILVGVGVVYGSTGLVTAGALALVAAVVLRYLR